MKKTNKKEERLIRIQAESDIYSVSEVVQESNAVKRLQVIHDCWLVMRQRHDSETGLKVRTMIYNPTFF